MGLNINPIVWKYNIDKRAYTANRKDLHKDQIVAKLDVCDEWFMPELAVYRCLSFTAYCEHVRHLAQHYHAKTVTVSALADTGRDHYISFSRNHSERFYRIGKEKRETEPVRYYFRRRFKNEGNTIIYDVNLQSESDLFPNLCKNTLETLEK